MYSERCPGVQRLTLKALGSYIPCSDYDNNKLVMRDNEAINTGTLDNEHARESGVAWNKGSWSCFLTRLVTPTDIVAPCPPSLVRGYTWDELCGTAKHMMTFQS